jgi:hypothetical protein
MPVGGYAMRRLSLFIGLGIVFSALGTTINAAPNPLSEQPVPQTLGANIQFTGSNDKDAGLIIETGFKFVRIDMLWSSIEKTAVTYDFSKYDSLVESLTAVGGRPIFILTCSNPLYDSNDKLYTPESKTAFTEFAKAAAAHFKNQGILWEINSESNTAASKTSTEDYVTLAKSIYPAIKSADPNAIVVVPVMAGFSKQYLLKCLDLGLLDAADVISVRPYRNSNPETAISDFLTLRETLRRYPPKGIEIPIISIEGKHSSVDIPESTKANYIQRILLSNLLAGVRLSVWLDLSDDNYLTNENYRFNLVDQNSNFKPSYSATQLPTRELEGCKFVSRLESENNDYILLFNGPQGHRLAAWTTVDSKNISVPIDVPSVTVVSMDKKSDVKISNGTLKLKLSQSPIYVEIGQSKRLAMEEALTFTTDIETRWRVQDVVTATINNPFKEKIKGNITVTVLGQKKPYKKRFALNPSDKTNFKFDLNPFWDGYSRIKADTVLTIDGIDTPINRTVDLPTSHRISAKVSCPLGRVLQFRVFSPANMTVKGKLRLYDVKGLKLSTTIAHFQVDSQTIVGFTLDEFAPKEFSLGYELIDGVGRVIFRSPVMNYTILEDFSTTTDGQPLTDYDVILDGDSKVSAKVIAQASNKDSPFTSLPPIPVCRLWYDFDAGQRYVRVSPTKEIFMPTKPVEVGAWVCGDNSGDIVRCRFVDSTGQVFQSPGFTVDWMGWRYRSMSLEPLDCSRWGGVNDGNLHPPLKWNSIFILDGEGKQTKGTVYLGPIMLVSEPEKPQEQPVVASK